MTEGMKKLLIPVAVILVCAPRMVTSPLLYRL